MTLQLYIEDDHTGHSATALVTGSPPLATNSLYVQRVSGNLGSGSWQPAGQMQGGGDLQLSLERGYYWAHCLSSLDDTTISSNLVYFCVHHPDDAVQYRCLQAVQARIRALALPGVADESVLVRKLASDRDLGPSAAYALPAIQISPHDRETMSIDSGTNLRDDVIYRVLVTIWSVGNHDHESALAEPLDWRQHIARAFRNQPLPGVPEVFHCEVAPHDVLSADALLRHSLCCSSLVLQFHAREPRGLAT